MTPLRKLTAAAVLAGLAMPGLAAAQDRPDAAPDRAARSGIEFSAIDTDANGSLSREELTARAVARLGAADGNGDGTLERAEIIAVMPAPSGALIRLFAPDPAEARADAMLERLGAEDGRIEITVLADRHVNALLARVDRDFDGVISQEEAEAANARRGHHGRDRSGGRGDDGRDGHGWERDRF